MFNLLFQFEWRYHTRQISFYLACAVFLVLGYLFSASQGQVDAALFINAPYNITRMLGILSLPAIFVVATFANNAMLRDSAHKVTELIYVTPLKKSHLLFTRFLGFFAASVLAFSAAPLGMLIDAITANEVNRLVGPISLFDYLWGFGVVVIPTMFVAASLMLAISVFTRNQISNYILATLLYVAYFVSAVFLGSPMLANSVPAAPDIMALASLLDPFGLSAFFEQVQNWSVAERNSQTIELTGAFLMNRLIWVGVGFVILALVYMRFSKKLVLDNTSSKSSNKTKPDNQAVAQPYMTVSPVGQINPHWWAFISLVKLDVKQVIMSLPFAATLAVATISFGTEMLTVLSNSPNSQPSYPTTAALIDRIQWDVLLIIGGFILIYNTAEVLWRERALNVSAFLDSSPTSNFAFFTSKFLALAMIPVALIITAILLAVGIQISQGYSDFEPLLYLSLFYYGGLPLAMLAGLFLFCQVVSPNKYIGMGLSFFSLGVLAGPFSAIFGIEHPMLAFSLSPSSGYSDMNGYESASFVYGWYMLYWTVLTFIISLIGIQLWRRGSEAHSWRSSMRQLKGLFTGDHRALFAGAVAIFVAAAGYIFYQTNIIGGYMTSADSLDWQESYERRYSKYQDMPMPTLKDINTEMDLYPAEHAWEMRGRYEYVNDTGAPIDSMLIYLSPNLDRTLFELSGATLVEDDHENGSYIFEFDAPLIVGATTQLSFEIANKDLGFFGGTAPSYYAENGMFLLNPGELPRLGYQKLMEIPNGVDRRDRGLPPRTEMLPLEKALQAHAQTSHNGEMAGSYEQVTFETIVSTAVDQTAIAPGDLIGDWVNNGRRYFHYKSDEPINNVIPYASARYEIYSELYNGVTLEIYYNPERATNVESLARAMRDAHTYMSSNYGQYNASHLRVLQVSSLTRVNGFAAPTLVVMGENTVFNFDDRADDFLVDRAYRTTVHELAHQWWGHNLFPADSEIFEGGLVLVETLARYSELMMIEARYGQTAARRWVNFELGRYLSGRANSGEEVPLYRVNDQDYLMYSKGTVAMYALKELLGEDTINRALRSLIQDFADHDRPATSLDLIAALYKVSAASHHAIIDEWFKDIILYDFRINKAKVEPLSNGKFRIDFTVSGKKSRADKIGVETELDFIKKVEIAIFDEKGDDIFEIHSDSSLISLSSYDIITGENKISVIVDKKPSYLAIDPYYKLLDRNRDNNMAEID